MAVTVFKNCRFLFASAEPEGITTGDSVVVSDQSISYVGDFETYLQENPDAVVQTVIDCSDKLVMPGLIDGHNHLCNTHMNISRAFPFDYGHISEHMLTTIHDPYGWLTPESLYDISMASAINALKHGATTVENSTILPDTAYEVMEE
ncbi:MAG: amidohydrolase family protein, partial [Odoribacter splanchnicus]